VNSHIVSTDRFPYLFLSQVAVLCVDVELPYKSFMGAGASAKYQSAYENASVTDLQEVLSSLDDGKRKVLKEALTSASSGDCSAEATGEIGGGVAVAGENEDNLDSELALELSRQEMMFLKCLRKRAERDKQRKLQKEAQRAAARAKAKQALEASFENEVDVVLQLLDEGVEPDCADEHGTTLLSEAASGGALDVLEMLLGEGCDVNSIGRYNRTPLWRAAYAGQANLIRLLLRAGADPRDRDEQGAKPYDVASNPESRELLLCWDTTATERIQQANVMFRKQNNKQAEKEEKQKVKRQSDELTEAAEEAARKVQIAKSELAKARKLLSDYRQQKVSLTEVGETQKLADLEPLIEDIEGKVKLYETTVQEWEWKSSRAKLKMSDFQQAEKEKADKKAGKVQGFKMEVKIDDLADLELLLPHLTSTLDIKKDCELEYGGKQLEFKQGDSLIKDGPFAYMTKREFNLQMLSAYGHPPAEKEEEKEENTAEEAEKPPEEPPFPVTLYFARGFNRTIDFRQLADVLLKDVGDVRKQDGRCPLIIDPSGRTSKGIKYLECTTFPMTELVTMDPLRLRRALLTHMMYGGAVIIDLENFDFSIDVIDEQFSKVERGLLAKLTDRTSLYSYLLPRRFRTLINKDVKNDYQECMFLDEALTKFVLGFITQSRNPDFEFAKQFFTVQVKGSNDDEEEK